MTNLPVIYQLIICGFGMSLFSLIGGIGYTITHDKLNKFMSLFIATASGTLLGGSLFHMMPHAIEKSPNILHTFMLLVLGFTLMYAMELFIHWHHCHKHEQAHSKPQGIMILFADGLHNFLAGLGIGAAFLIDAKLGFTMWLVALLHEIPQEIGDYAILLHSGIDKKRALLLNFISSLTFPLAMFLVYGLNTQIDMSFLVPVAAGNFIYIAASDLIPEVKEHPKLLQALWHLLAFLGGLSLLIIPALMDVHH